MKIYISDKNIEKDIQSLVSNYPVEVVYKISRDDIKSVIKKIPKGTGLPLEGFFNDAYNMVTFVSNEPSVQNLRTLVSAVGLIKILIKVHKKLKRSGHSLYFDIY